jgi:hypothetical protein
MVISKPQRISIACGVSQLMFSSLLVAGCPRCLHGGQVDSARGPGRAQREIHETALMIFMIFARGLS